MISEARLEKALTMLATSDEQIAELKANVARTEYLCKLARSREYIKADGSVEARKAIAEVSDAVQIAEGIQCDAILDYEKLKAKRATEELIVDVWRSLNSARTKGVIT